MQPEDQAHGRGLSGAVRPEKSGDHARPYGEGQVIDGGFLAVPLGEVVDHDHVKLLESCRGWHGARPKPGSACCRVETEKLRGDDGVDRSARTRSDIGGFAGAESNRLESLEGEPQAQERLPEDLRDGRDALRTRTAAGSRRTARRSLTRRGAGRR